VTTPFHGPAGGHAGGTEARAVGGHSPARETAAAAEAEDHTLMYVSAAIAVAGIVLAWWLYVRRRDLALRAAQAMPEVHDLLHHKYFIDEWNDASIVRPLWQSGQAAFTLDNLVVDGILRLITAVPRTLGLILRTLQDGFMQSYGVTMTASLLLVVLVVWLFR
jgi:NADH-quinone oxidoreductase subunit L